MVDKILFQDKNYNFAMFKINQKENRIDILNRDIQKLEEEYQMLRNNCKVYY